VTLLLVLDLHLDLQSVLELRAPSSELGTWIGLKLAFMVRTTGKQNRGKDKNAPAACLGRCS